MSKFHIILHHNYIGDKRMRPLTGNIDGKLDSKGRAFLPASFRHQLDGCTSFYIRKDVFQNCLILYPEASWEETVSVLRQRLSPWNKREDQIFRQFVADADYIELEENGRMLLPKRHLKNLNLQGEIKFIGKFKNIEIWPIYKAEETFIDEEALANELEKLMKDSLSEK
jgi:MraZ protein